jgi:hypothetical protein
VIEMVAAISLVALMKVSLVQARLWKAYRDAIERDQLDAFTCSQAEAHQYKNFSLTFDEMCDCSSVKPSKSCASRQRKHCRTGLRNHSFAMAYVSMWPMTELSANYG